MSALSHQQQLINTPSSLVTNMWIHLIIFFLFVPLLSQLVWTQSSSIFKIVLEDSVMTRLLYLGLPMEMVYHYIIVACINKLILAYM
jgi:hypothetical protein